MSKSMRDLINLLNEYKEGKQKLTLCYVAKDGRDKDLFWCCDYLEDKGVLTIMYLMNECFLNDECNLNYINFWLLKFQGFKLYVTNSKYEHSLILGIPYRNTHYAVRIDIGDPEMKELYYDLYKKRVGGVK